MSAAVFGKQGITSILASDCDSPKMASSSLRRTLSADMSSRKWVAQNLPDQEHRLDDIKDEEHDSGSESQFDIWNSIQKQRKEADGEEQSKSDVWGSILAQKNDQPAPAAPYIHPLVKKSARSLSMKSLEVCTESLGSETGSDGFSSYPSSEAGETEEEFTGETTERAVSLNLTGKKMHMHQLTRSRSFPPPIPSISRQNGASLHVRSHRDNGRLVLEAVSVKEQNNFRAQREDGRLVLTFIDDASVDDRDGSDKNVVDGDGSDGEESDDGFEDFGDEDIQEGDMETEETGEKMEAFTEEMPITASGEVSVNKLAILMNKPVVLANTNPVLSDRFGKVVILKDMDEETLTMLTQVIPRPPPPTLTAKSYGGNTYEYFWRTESTELVGPATKPSIHVIKSYFNNNTNNNSRRSCLFLGPRCIAA